mgnify:CR=1 FL=1
MRIYGTDFQSRMMLGTAAYPSPAVMVEALNAAQPAMVTVSLRREAASGKAGAAFWALVREAGFPVLPIRQGASVCGKPSPPRRWRARFLPPISSSWR